MMLSINQAASALGGKAYGRRILCPGPGHSRNDRSLQITIKPDGSFSTRSFAGDDFRECRDYVKARLGIDDRAPLPIPPAPTVPSSGGTAAQRRAVLRLWDSSVPIAGTPAEAYLAGRGLSYDGNAIRYRAVGTACMVALITDAITGEPIGAHRTLISADGRPITRDDGSKVRLIYGRATGGVIRLHDHEAPSGLAIAEGIETALATGAHPAWACISSGVMKGLPVIDGAPSITIFADHDRAGIEAANECGARWHGAGRSVKIIAPSSAGADFADMGGVQWKA